MHWWARAEAQQGWAPFSDVLFHTGEPGKPLQLSSLSCYTMNSVSGGHGKLWALPLRGECKEPPRPRYEGLIQASKEDSSSSSFQMARVFSSCIPWLLSFICSVLLWIAFSLGVGMTGLDDSQLLYNREVSAFLWDKLSPLKFI